MIDLLSMVRVCLMVAGYMLSLYVEDRWSWVVWGVYFGYDRFYSMI